MEKENRILLKNSIASIIIKGFDYLVVFLTTPLLLRCLGDYKYGVYATTLSIISWIYYFDFGVGNGLRNKITEAYAKNDLDSVKKNVSVAFVLVGFLSTIIIIMGLVFCFFTDLEQLLNASVENENLNQILFIAIVLAAVNFLLSLSGSILLAIKKTALNNAFAVVAKLLFLGFLVVLVLGKIELLGYVVIAEGIAQLLKNIIATVYVVRTDNNLVFSFSKVDFSYSKGILGFGVLIFIMQISALVLNSTDNLIIQKLFSAEEVTPYNLCFKYYSIINALFAATISPFWASYTSAYVEKNKIFIKKTLKKSWLMYVAVLLMLIVMTFIFEPFMRLYLGREVSFPLELKFLMALYFVILILSHTFSTFIHAISKVKLTTVACVISAVLNIPLSIYFATTAGMGINGVILGSIICIAITTVTYIYVTFIELKKLEMC
jgi:O-antigen/teichoic acid export membrane protein